jgi:hypothetical protein
MDSSAKVVFLCHGRSHLKYKDIGGITIPSKVWDNGFYVDKNYLSFPDYVGTLDTIPQDVIAKNSKDAVFMVHPPSHLLAQSPLLISKIVHWLKPGGLFVAPHNPHITSYVNTQFKITLHSLPKSVLDKCKKLIIASHDPVLVDILHNKKPTRVKFENWVTKQSDSMLKLNDFQPLDPDVSVSNIYVFKRI